MGRGIAKLFLSRPISFWGKNDRHCLKTYLTPQGALDSERFGGFDAIGTAEEKEPLILQHYQSADEACLAALVSVFVPTLFVNNGEWKSGCQPGKPGSFEKEGVLVGSVGAKLLRDGDMESRFMLVTIAPSLMSVGR